MQQLTFVARGRVEFREVAEPALDSEEGAIVRPTASTTCDLDRAIIAGRTPFEGPFAIGHECVGEVVDAGGRSGGGAGVLGGGAGASRWLGGPPGCPGPSPPFGGGGGLAVFGPPPGGGPRGPLFR